MSIPTAPAVSPSQDTAFFGHPRGLSTLFFTEMWERFSYYGIRALLILYMTAEVSKHGLGLSVAIAGAIYGLYTSCAYVFALPAGWIADRFLGHQNSVILGGLLIAAGNFGLMAPSSSSFLLSLLVMAIGTSFLKTSCTTVVGFLYAQGDSRRDSGFTIYYIGINIGAALAPFICGYIGQRIDYRYGFGVAGLFMLAGLTQFAIMRRNLHGAGRRVAVQATDTDRKVLGAGTVVLFGTLMMLAWLGVAVENIADGFAALLMIAVLVTFTSLLSSKNFTSAEKKRLYVVLVLFIASMLFWSIFEQAGSTLNLFADRSTRNEIFGYEFPSTLFQALNSMYIFALGPFFAWLWLALRDRNPSLITKFAIGLLGVGASFLLMVLAAHAIGADGKVSPLWLVSVYLIQTIAELCLSPVGLSAITKLTPTRIAGFAMGVWFLSISVGNFIAGRMSSFYESMPLDQLVGYGAVPCVALGVILLVITRPVTKLMGGVK
jgi:POT family proton-dependent oligopeptide transporter